MKSGTIASLKVALDRLGNAESCGAWSALESLGDIARDGVDLTIDFAASREVGAPVIVATLRPEPPALLSGLTPRRRRVAELLLAGHSNKAIARALDISLGTVKDHVHAILAALGLRSRAELISAALAERNRS